ncbi:MAG: exodeoxyribonuclease III [Candidatus Muproteobacteria bacterium RBG_16_64_11]|uniref:Exodeoxyribonuclease III n=1 Tax=Candidatus Muproteobacteria bacterium RBG_16_64_11 TaxID=1817758 RepID=A0A1F6TCY5_9PROT|nr:MAG: exodeoxyribonuclease III [Candidatus Muproteobacteria bacterium RBG_16_64_11]
MKIATWNVNSLRVRLPQVLDWIREKQPDVLCLQETKVTDDDFPLAACRDAGYHVAFSGQKTYNGVATLSRAPLAVVANALPDFADDQKRLLAATIGDVRVINGYVPNGQEVGSDKYAYKLDWLRALRRLIAAELKTYPKLALLGDFNIAPQPRDVHDPQAWEGKVLFSEPERAAFRALAETGLEDLFRAFEQPENSFSWWDYRSGAFRRNHGLRIDHILASAGLSARCRACAIDTAPRALERPSDHAPVLAELDLG